MSDTRSAPPPAVRGVVRTTIDIAAPPARVFRALTDPGERAAWWRDSAGAPVAAESSLPGTCRVLDPPHVLEHTWPEGGDDGAPATVRYELAPALVDGAPGTQLTVTHTGPAVTACADAGRAGGVERLARVVGDDRAAVAGCATYRVYAVSMRAAPHARAAYA